MSAEILDGSADAVRGEYRSGAMTPVDVLEHTLARIESRNPAINAIAYVDAAGARAAALASAQRWTAGTPLGAMDGLPVTIKDSVHAVGMPWRHGCAANAQLADSTFDAPPTARLKEAGAVIVGKTTMPDFGMMAAGVSSLYGVTRNPWDLSRSTGGSSAGAGAALAVGIGFSSVGSDIAGSVRLPAGHCGLVALKPTQGRIPHTAPSTMRSAGPMGRTVDDVMDMYDVLSRPDARDLWSLPPEASPVAREALDPNGLRIGVLTELGGTFGADDAVLSVVADAAAALRGGGAAVSAMAPVFTDDPYPALDRSAERMRAACAEFDYVIAPVIPTVGFAAEDTGLDPAYPLAHCGFTAWFNQTAQPASALCFGFSDGMPVGIQVIGPRFADQQVLRLTKWLESRRPVPVSWPEPAAALRTGGI
jgi:amidase/aspartyl-tRNA(Asn)/glutamyl-tRNA(Gln) amidotransferase subunit A